MTRDVIRRDYYVYALIDPRNNQPFYIGKGTKRRVKGHYLPSALKRFGTKNYRNNLILKYRELGFSDKYKIYQSGLTEEQARTLEYDYIKLFGRKIDGGCLTNRSKGDREEIRKRESTNETWKRNVGNASKGRTHTDETKELLRKASTGYQHSEGAKEKISKTHKNKPKTEAHKENLRVYSPLRDAPKTEQQRTNISEKLKGRPKPPRTQDHKDKISEANKGRKNTPEHAAILVEISRTRVRSEEEKEKARLLCASNSEKFKKSYKLISPEGEILVIKGLNDFVRKSDPSLKLDVRGFYKAMKEGVNLYKNWHIERL